MDKIDKTEILANILWHILVYASAIYLIYFTIGMIRTGQNDLVAGAIIFLIVMMFKEQ